MRDARARRRRRAAHVPRHVPAASRCPARNAAAGMRRLPCELHLEERERAVARRDHEPARARRRATVPGRAGCRARASAAEHLERRAVERREGRRLGRERAHGARELDGGSRPVEARVLALDARRERDAVRRLRRRHASCPAREPVERLAERRRAELREPLAVRLPPVSSGAIGVRAHEQHVAGVHLLAHRHDGDAGLGVARQDRVLDRRGAAMARQDRRVHVDAAVRRQVEDRAAAGCVRTRRRRSASGASARSASSELGRAHLRRAAGPGARARARASSPAAAASASPRPRGRSGWQTTPTTSVAAARAAPRGSGTRTPASP